MGISWSEFWNLNPRIIKLYVEGHKEKIKEIDYLLWLMGKYNFDAQMVALNHFGAGLSGKRSQAEYLEKPYMQRTGGQYLDSDSISEDEKQREVDLFFAREKARRVNWKRTHKM